MGRVTVTRTFPLSRLRRQLPRNGGAESSSFQFPSPATSRARNLALDSPPPPMRGRCLRSRRRGNEEDSTSCRAVEAAPSVTFGDSSSGTGERNLYLRISRLPPLPRMKRQMRRDPRRGRQDGFGPDGRQRLMADESVDAERRTRREQGLDLSAPDPDLDRDLAGRVVVAIEHLGPLLDEIDEP